MARTESQRTRLTDLAEQAGVSTATVSRVLNGKAGVATDTRQAVLAALDLFGYERPEKLRTSSAGLVGLIVPELSNPVFPAFAQSIETHLSGQGYTPVLCTQSPGGTTEDEYIEMLLAHDVAGIVFVSGLHADTQASMERYHRLHERSVPMVMINGYTDGVRAAFISNDDFSSMELSVRHLVSLGHRSIGFATGQDRYVPVRRKRAGFADALERHLGPGPIDDHVATSLFTVEGGQAAAGELIDSGHTGIICGSDLMALGATRAARARGLDVGRDVSIVGYDDSPLIAFTEPPLTTIRQPVAAMGNAAVAALMSQISGEPAPRTELLFHPELVVRESTGIAPVAAGARASE